MRTRTAGLTTGLRWSSRAQVAVALWCCACAGSAAAAEKPPQVEGVVKFHDGTVPTVLNVSLTSEDGGVEAVVVMVEGKEGRYALSGVPPGTYTMVVSAASATSQGTWTQQVVINPASSQSTVIDVVMGLKPSAPTGPAPRGGDGT